MDWKRYLAIFLIAFTGFCCVMKVDRQCLETTGEGGKAGLTLSREEGGRVAFCFFGMEGEIGP